MPECGSPLLSANVALAEYIVIKVASFDDPAPLVPALDIWTASAQPWAVLDPATRKVDKDLRRR